MVSQQRFKEIFLLILKVTLAVALVTWLVKSDKLDFRQLAVLKEHPALLLFNITSWIIGPLILCSWRWLLLLRGLGYQLKYAKALKLHFIGLFFNAAMPGAVGGDLIKVAYVIRDNRSLGKTNAMMSVLLDRVVGLLGLFTIGSIVILAGGMSLLKSDGLRSMASIIILSTVAGIVVLCSAFIKMNPENDPFARSLGKFSFLSPLQKIYLSFRSYQHTKSYLFGAFIISILIQLILFIYFYVLTYIMVTPSVSLTDLAIVFPIGIASTAIPLAPGGIGVGHMAFESLFANIGLSGGANVFNVYVISSLALSMFGAIPYVTMRRKKKTPLHAEAAVVVEQ